MVVGILHIQLGNSDGPLDRVYLSHHLKDAGEGVPKLHGLWGALRDHGLIHA